MALTVKIRGDATHLEKTLASAKKGVSGLASGMLKFGAAGAGFAAMLAGLNGVEAVVTKLGGFLKDASVEAASVESLTMQFKTLLGSADAAKKRMEELVKFANTTPFEVKELSQTSKLLQTLGGTMLATGEGLRMVGDAAAIAGQPLEEVGLHIGRIFNALTSGTSAGESIARMQELGLMTGTVKRQFEDLAAAQKKGERSALTNNEALKLLRETFKSTEGAMEELSNTTEGKFSNLKGTITSLQVALGTGINEGLKVAMDAANESLPMLEGRFKAFGDNIGKAIADAVKGNYEIIVAAGNVVGQAFVAGFRDVAGNMIVEAIRGYMQTTGEAGGVGAAATVASNALLGAPATISGRAMDLETTMAPVLQTLDETITKRDMERQTEVMNKVLRAIEELPKGIMGVSKEQMKNFIMVSR